MLTAKDIHVGDTVIFNPDNTCGGSWEQNVPVKVLAIKLDPRTEESTGCVNGVRVTIDRPIKGFSEKPVNAFDICFFGLVPNTEQVTYVVTLDMPYGGDHDEALQLIESSLSGLSYSNVSVSCSDG